MNQPPYVAFSGEHQVGAGTLVEAAVAAKRALGDPRANQVLIFDTDSGHVVDLDLRGSFADITARYATPPEPKVARGRPKLGVVAREVTLLPRHWEWLSRQPGGASAALRRMIDQARKDNEGADALMTAREAAYRFMTTLAGDRPGYEEATRSLFRGDHVTLGRQMANWPPDIRRNVLAILVEAHDRLEPETPSHA
jgi:hypothetical protein